jgi:hypothetical protein
MLLLQTLIGVFYYALVAFVAYLIIASLLRTRDWQEEVMYVLILLPFALRLLRLK